MHPVPGMIELDDLGALEMPEPAVLLRVLGERLLEDVQRLAVAAVADRVSKVDGIYLAAPLVEGQALASSPFNASGVVVRGMLGADVSGDPKDRTAADNQTVRNVFVIGPDKKVKLVLVYPMTTGRNFDEVLRVIDSLQLTARHKVATPVNWKQGEDVIIAGSVSDDDAKKTYPQGWKAPKPYIRIVPQPQ